MKAAPTIASPVPIDIVKALAESARDPLLVVEPQSLRILQVNEKATAFLGYEEGEVQARTLDQLVDARSLEAIRQSASLCGANSLHAARFELNHGKTRDVRLSVQLVANLDQFLLLLTVFDPDSPLDGEAACPYSPPTTNRPDGEDLIETTVDFPTIIGQSSQIRDVCRLIGLVAKTDTTVLVQGESGTGKELVAQAVHFHSQRARNPLVKVNCAALTETLLESELFGHKKGSFTGAIQDRKGRFKLADRGTIILDEIGSMCLSGQAKLLRVLQEKEFEPVGDSLTVRVDVRVIAITNADLVKAIQAGTFREDLYYRLNAFPIQLPSLRDRRVDIPTLARHFLEEYSVSLKRHITSIDREAISLLTDYGWPGNVRELENAIEYAVILEKGKSLSAPSLPEKLRPDHDLKVSLKERLEFAERQILLEALSETGWVKNRAAKLLGIDRRNLSYFLNKHGIH